ncbi:unnamed protein product [Onchocerca flexuosa]|uniref:Ovule protein n=1 Tax=Onchocerca flexuosa TaxID=387005 RepID=A0A183HZX4_9BILA|nr:unnamed protein product [Onchocerca flexuosa]
MELFTIKHSYDSTHNVLALLISSRNSGRKHPIILNLEIKPPNIIISSLYDRHVEKNNLVTTACQQRLGFPDHLRSKY